MNEKEKDILERISEKAEMLDIEEQQYLLGVAQGMSIMKGRQEDRKKENDGLQKGDREDDPERETNKRSISFSVGLAQEG